MLTAQLRGHHSEYCTIDSLQCSALEHSTPSHRVSALQFKANKVVYRRYAGLFFAMCIDVTDNELAYLESIHLFVEILDHYFNNVCELDLVFNFHKVRERERCMCHSACLC